jgi:hypothetical protein
MLSSLMEFSERDHSYVVTRTYMYQYRTYVAYNALIQAGTLGRKG